MSHRVNPKKMKLNIKKHSNISCITHKIDEKEAELRKKNMTATNFLIK